jgi:UDP-N-acetyl-D-glucosamine dehydrogenase
MGLDVWEVIKGAASKPFGFMPFYPGPGLGGHCIPIDPFYLSWKARLHNFEPAFIELAGRINNQMPQYVVGKVVDLLNEMGKCVRGAKILILGVAYKKNVGDTRESPAFEIIETLLKKGGRVFYHDPFVERFKNEFFDLKSIELTEKNLKKMDCVVLVTDHQQLNYKLIVQSARKILDTRNALGAFTGSKQVSEKIVCI